MLAKRDTRTGTGRGRISFRFGYVVHEMRFFFLFSHFFSFFLLIRKIVWPRHHTPIKSKTRTSNTKRAYHLPTHKFHCLEIAVCPRGFEPNKSMLIAVMKGVFPALKRRDRFLCDLLDSFFPRKKLHCKI